MTDVKKTQDSLNTKPADKTKPASELSENELKKVSGGGISQACATGKHFAGGKITV